MTPSEPASAGPGSLLTSLTSLVDVAYPIVQPGMAWVAGPRLAAAVSNAGALGILSSAGMTIDQLDDAIAEVNARTDSTFGVCLVNLSAELDEAMERARLLVERGVRVAQLAVLPLPPRVVLDFLKNAGVVVMPAVGSRRAAEQAAEWGADAVIVEGSEGGGHMGEAPSTVLLPQVVDAVSIPVVAAGGFHDGRGLVAALAYGAAGVAMGTRFLLTRESAIPDAVKDRYLAATTADMTVTRSLDGFARPALLTVHQKAEERPGPAWHLAEALWRARSSTASGDLDLRRALRSVRRLKQHQGLDWRSALYAARAPVLIKASLEGTGPGSRVLASGLAAGVITDLPSCADLVAQIIAQARAVTQRLPA